MQSLGAMAVPLSDKKPVLLLVDIQTGFADVEYWGGHRNNPEAELRAGEILAAWRTHALSIIHVWHSSTNLASPLHETNTGFAVHPAVAPKPDEPVIIKHVNSAFIGTDLQDRLKEMNASTLVIIGLTTDHCISTTVRMSGNFDYETMIISDAVATFDKIDITGKRWPAETVHAIHLASLKDEFAEILDTETLLDRL